MNGLLDTLLKNADLLLADGSGTRRWAYAAA